MKQQIGIKKKQITPIHHNCIVQSIAHANKYHLSQKTTPPLILGAAQRGRSQAPHHIRLLCMYRVPTVYVCVRYARHLPRTPILPHFATCPPPNCTSHLIDHHLLPPQTPSQPHKAPSSKPHQRHSASLHPVHLSPSTAHSAPPAR